MEIAEDQSKKEIRKRGTASILLQRKKEDRKFSQFGVIYPGTLENMPVQIEVNNTGRNDS